MHWPILEVFDFGNYEGVDVNGKVVIDVGAFVGDTAMYFILKGARRVIAIEPLPANYEELLDNVYLNNMEGRIVPINAMVSSRRMIVEIPTNVPIYIRGGSISEFRRYGAGSYVNIESITISDIIDRFGIDPNDAVLKMDCEGCEYDVVLNDYEHVKLFGEVVFEYHAYAVHRPIAELISTMSKDFNCQTINENFYRKFFSDYSRDQLGLIRCIKRS
jgi:FkbM family methyltransferase